jgi:ABC-type bacteriocin/lantibiotic exporter with double-glycine peptidase domain
MAASAPPLTPVQRFWRLLKPDKSEIRNVYVYAVFAGLVNLSLPLGIQAIVNLIQGGRVSTAWLLLVALVAIGLAVVGILQIQQMRIVENLQQKVFTRAAFEFAYRIPRIRTEVLYNYYGPELMNRFFDVLTVQKGLPKILIDFSVAALQTIFGLLLLSLYHPFFIAFGVILILLVALIFFFTAKPGLDTSLKESKYKYAAAHWLEELARTASTFKLAGRTNMAMERMDRHVNSYLTARESHFGILIRQYSLLIVFKVIVALGLLAIGGVLVMDQQMNIGQFVAAEIIIIFVMSSVEKIVSSLETVYDLLTGLEKIGQVTDLDLDSKAGDNPQRLAEDPTRGMSVQLEGVTFHYPTRTEPTLRDVDLYIGPGERVFVTGSNGAGKSTLLYLIAGLYDVQQGSVAYDDLPRGSLDLEHLHSVIGDCLRQGELFEGTVEENIGMGRKGATPENIRWAIESMGLSDVIRRMPNGYGTKLNPTGDKLPRNVMQRMLLARAIADKPRLLLLEDVFEAIDGTDRKEIIDFLISSEHPWTLVAVSNNDYLATCCTRIVEMEGGRIVTSARPS